MRKLILVFALLAVAFATTNPIFLNETYTVGFIRIR